MKIWFRCACSAQQPKHTKASWQMGLLIVLAGAAAHASTITVDNASSGSIGGACTLQDAVAAANTNAVVNGCAAGTAGADTIVFAPSITTIVLTAPMPSANAPCTFGLAITDDLTIDGGAAPGSGVPKVTIQRSSAPGTPDFGVIGASLYNCGTTPTKKLNLTLAGVAIRNGNNTGNGGGVAADILTVRDSAFAGSHANDGGGVYAFTSLLMTSSTVSGNSSSFAAGIEAAGAATISGSTINGNTGTGVGGGPLTIDNSTISGNTGDGIETDSIAAYFVTITANAGAGLRLDVALGNSAVAEFDDSLLVNNAPSAPFVHDLETSASRPITGTYDYFGTLSAVAANDIDPSMRIAGCAGINLGPLANNGGGTQTHALLTGSCLIDAGGIVSPGGFLFASDQRGNGFPRFFNTHADIGAFEYQGAPAPVDGACGSDNGQTLLAAPTNLCGAGSASAISGSGHPWSWTCNSTTGGANASCAATIKTWTVTAAVSGAGGTVSPASQTVDNGATASVTASAALNYSLASASGCGSGSLSGNVYTTAAITASCAVSVAFTAIPVATVVLGSSANPAQAGQSITLTATVTGSGATPTGTVNFYDGAAYLGSVATAAPARSGATPSAALNASGIASLTTTGLSVGSHAISASYLGDATYAAASSNTLVESVSAAVAPATPVPAPTLTAWALGLLTACIALSTFGRRARLNFLAQGLHRRKTSRSKPMSCKSIVFPLAATLMLGLAPVCAPSQPATATTNDGPSSAVAATRAEKLQAAQATLARMQQIADRFSGEAAALGYEDNAWRFELVNHLMRADQATVANVEAAVDLRSALQAAAPSTNVASAKSLGQATGDLIYVPISPCRIVDTRNSGAGGNFVAREIRTYTYQGGAAQGGATCTFTAGATPAALAVNVTAVSLGLGNNPNAFGFLSVYPEGGSPTTTAWLNYLGSDTKGNAGVASINQADGKFSVYAQNPTHVVIDLFGVFRAATDGTPNFISKWDGAGTLGTSSIYDDGTRVHIGPGTVRNNQVEIGGVGNNYSGNALVIGNGTQGMSFAQTAVSQWFTDTDFSLMPAFAGTGRLGIGTATPTHMVDVVGVNAQIQLTASQNGATATLSRYTNRLEISPSDAFQVSVGTIASTDLYVAANHDVGIGTGAPVNRLQIGSLGSTGYGGNDIAIGNGTQASGITQFADHVQWSSSTDIALMPQGNGHGRVGINTTAPVVPLEVDDYVPNSAAGFPSLNGPNNRGYVYFTVQQAGGSFDNWDPNIDHCSNGCYAHVSILAPNGNVMAQEMDVYSDARIKDVVGVSDAGNDLAILNSIEVADYTLKDKFAHGNHPFKKVIAQQVETVYPQVVNRHTDFVPNVYRVASETTTVAAGTLLHFDAAHGIAAETKRLRLIVEGETTWRKLGVLDLPSSQDVVVDAGDIAGKRVFVYGEEVDDFRTVDYEGLTTLNISATQELARRLAQKDREIATLHAEVDALKAAQVDLAELKAQFAQFRREAAAATPANP